MSSPNASPTPDYPPLQVRLKYAAVPVVVLMAGYFAATHYYAGRIESETLARLPERPALGADNAALAPVLDQATRAVQEEPTAGHLGQLGKIYHANGFASEAVACYRRALELDNTDAQWPYLLACIQGVAGEPGGSLDLLDRTVELEPTYVPALLRRADALYDAGDLEGAQSGYLRCLDLEMGNGWARLGLGRIAIDHEDWAEAENQLGMALEGNPNLVAAYPLLATAHEKQGKDSTVVPAEEGVDAGDGEVAYPDPWLDALIQYCYDTEKLMASELRAERNGQWEEAQWALGRVLEIAPENFAATARMGALLQHQGQVEEAEPLLRNALTLTAPSAADYAKVNANLGNNYLWQDKPELAAEYFRAALDTDPDFELAHQGLAACYLEFEQYEKAAEHGQRAAALNAASHEAQYNWGQALLHLGREDEALQHFSEAARLNPTLPPAEYMAGAYYFKQGNMEKAVPYLEKAAEHARARGDRRLEARIQTMLGRPE